jgi:hypothetical protein
MGALGGFAPPFGPTPATISPLASLGLAKPCDGAPPARARAKRAGWAGWRVVPKSPQGAKPAGSPRARRPNTAKPPWLSTRAAKILSEAG